MHKLRGPHNRPPPLQRRRLAGLSLQRRQRRAGLGRRGHHLQREVRVPDVGHGVRHGHAVLQRHEDLLHDLDRRPDVHGRDPRAPELGLDFPLHGRQRGAVQQRAQPEHGRDHHRALDDLVHDELDRHRPQRAPGHDAVHDVEPGRQQRADPQPAHRRELQRAFRPLVRRLAAALDALRREVAAEVREARAGRLRRIRRGGQAAVVPLQEAARGQSHELAVRSKMRGGVCGAARVLAFQRYRGCCGLWRADSSGLKRQLVARVL
mmetsp:Transcript_9405/g.28165  ORF Transcript_9405/g.28165 Transcript_9405/m.28165 type:complete len:264 (-) Transcript_9405:91-882(-)